MIIVARTDPHDPQATALLRQSHAMMQSLFNEGDCHYLNIDDLCAPHIHFFTARRGDVVIGTAALAIKEGYGEIKSMFVSQAARGSGAADALMRQLEDEAGAEDLPILKLETGDVLHAAHKLYYRHGFTKCEAFGDYETADASVFMEKSL